jgi:penicillin-binding protein 1A
MGKPRKNSKSKKAKTSFKTLWKQRRYGEIARRSVKWGFVLGIWMAMVVGVIIAWYAAELPGIIKNPHFELKPAITLLDDEGRLITRYGDYKGASLRVQDLPPHLVYAVLAVEDRRFYEHHGIDPVGMMRAAAVNLMSHGIAQGGSTITQQLAKNLFLSRARTFKRKIQEAILALWLEHELTKDEILAAYLNRVYLGSGAYGVDAAAHTYFNKPATKVTLSESAVLAGLLKAPSRYSPLNNPGLANKRAQVVLAAMRDAGYITESEEKKAGSFAPKPIEKPSETGGKYYYADWVVSELDRMIGDSDSDLTIRTTFDAGIQKAAEDALAASLRENEDRKVTQGAVVVMDLNGGVVAMVGGRSHEASQYNRAVQATRQPGSSFKPFTYLVALENGWSPDDKILDEKLEGRGYTPDNYNNEYMGEVPLRVALAYSLNSATIRLARQVGIGPILEAAHKAGIESKLPYNESVVLGSAGVPLLEMVTAYDTFATGGYRVWPYGIVSIKDESGKTLYRHEDLRGQMVFPNRAVRELQDMMIDVIEHGTGGNAKLPLLAAGKTGTSQDYRDAWFIGFTDQYVAGVWVGNDDNSPMKGVTGGMLPAKIWKQVMLEAGKKHPSAFRRPPASSAGRAGGGGYPGQSHEAAPPPARQQQGGDFSDMLHRLFSY